VVGLMRRMRDKSRGTARFEDGVVEDGHDVARRQDEQFVPQGRQRQSRARREAMFGRQRDDQRLADHHFAHQRMIAHRWTHEREVELSIDERGQLRRNRQGLRLHLEVSVLSIEGAEKGRDIGLIRAVPDSDAQTPRGGRPRIPFIYSDEVWTGIEYQLATQLIFEGFVEDGLTVVRTARARHTGEFRSPWDDIEAGHHYARSLATWGLVIAASGVQYDGIARTLSFDPIADGRYPFTTGTAWGVATIAGDDVTLDVRGGRLDLASLSLRGRPLSSVGV
jgi:Glycosyl-hydrolase family 116, catalytic region